VEKVIDWRRKGWVCQKEEFGSKRHEITSHFIPHLHFLLFFDSWCWHLMIIKGTEHLREEEKRAMIIYSSLRRNKRWSNAHFFFSYCFYDSSFTPQLFQFTFRLFMVRFYCHWLERRSHLLLCHFMSTSVQSPSYIPCFELWFRFQLPSMAVKRGTRKRVESHREID
jgi:hypothetical protein